MSDLRAAAQRALEALEGEQPGWRTPAQERSIVALRAALAKQAEPTFSRDQLLKAVEAERHACSIVVWMTLQEALEDGADDRGLDGWMSEAEQRVKHRTTGREPVKPAQQEQAEPVAWAQLTVREIEECFRDANDDHIIAARNVELMVEKKNAASPQRRPLTDEEIKNIYVSKHWYEIGEFTWGAAKVVARAIERAHGIGGDV